MGFDVNLLIPSIEASVWHPTGEQVAVRYYSRCYTSNWLAYLNQISCEPVQNKEGQAIRRKL